MAITEKNSRSTKSKDGILDKIIGLLPGQKSTSAGKNKDAKNAAKVAKTMKAVLAKKQEKAATGSTTDPYAGEDVAHSPGHRKMDVKVNSSKKSGTKTQPQNASAMNQMAPSEKVRRTTSPQRRIITAASTGKRSR